MDFMSMLAQAQKNATNAQKMLQQNKQLKQKQELNKRDSTVNKQSTLDFINKKKEEARLRAEHEARELLEKRKQKLEQMQTQKEQKAASTKTGTSSTKAASSSSTTIKSKSTTNGNTNNHNAKATTSTAPKKTPANISSGNKKASATTNNKNTLTQKPQQSSSAPKRPMDYAEMLKLAEKNKELAKQPSFKAPAPPPTVIPSQKRVVSSAMVVKKPIVAKEVSKTPVQANNGVQAKGKSYLPGDIRAQQNGVAKVTKSAPTNSSSQKISSVPKEVKKDVSTASGVSGGGGTSAWDRAVSGLKSKVPTKKKEDEKKRANDISDDEDDEDEYDSEMDDFIDDDEEEEDEVGGRRSSGGSARNYSKYIREIFKYDPSRYRGVDEDDVDNMESSYAQIMKEERMSLKHAYMEDLEDMKIEAEEKKRHKQKKQKTS